MSAVGLLVSAGGVLPEDAMLTRHSFSWCHELNTVTDRSCAECGHRADRPRLACDCGQCRPSAGLPLLLGRLLATSGVLARLDEAGLAQIGQFESAMRSQNLSSQVRDPRLKYDMTNVR